MDKSELLTKNEIFIRDIKDYTHIKHVCLVRVAVNKPSITHCLNNTRDGVVVKTTRSRNDP